jgi:hypothetical protein
MTTLLETLGSLAILASVAANLSSLRRRLRRR